MRDAPHAGGGLVSVRATRPGEALLRDAADQVWRLSWSSASGGTFAVPAGTYRWLTYRVLQDVWHISVTGQLASLEVQAGGTASIEPQDGIKLHLRAVSGPRGVQAQVHVGGIAGGGLSIYRDGRRTPLTCTLLDGSGAEVGSAPVEYG